MSELGDLVFVEVPGPGGVVRRGVPKAVYMRQLDAADALLVPEIKPYLRPVEYIELSAVKEKTGLLSFTKPDEIPERVEAMKALGIGPLSDYDDPMFLLPDFPGFPVFSVFVHIFNNTLGKLISTRSGRERVIQDHRNIPAPSIREWQQMRTTGFDDDKLSLHVKREIEYHLRHHRADAPDPAYARLADHADFYFERLEQALVGVTPGKRRYYDFTLTPDDIVLGEDRKPVPVDDELRFISESFWHVRYTPEYRERVAHFYVAALRKRAIGVSNQEMGFNQYRQQMEALFPKICRDVGGRLLRSEPLR